jgi:glycine cleavage system protein P-like pyridoxal-binding family
MDEQVFDAAFEKYWGKYRQETKHTNCKTEVDNFCEDFKKIANEPKRLSQKATPSKKRKPTKKGKC